MEGDKILPKGAGRHGISIHALRVEGDLARAVYNVAGCISIHALRVEGDEDYAGNFGQAMISIHALRVEGDFDFREPTAAPEIFLSTPSGWRATARSAVRRSATENFYPRPPGGGRPVGRRASPAAATISIHALRVEGDV